jgi:hypothetical protein
MVSLNRLGWIIFLLISAYLIAQSSTNYIIEQGTFNNGGNPAPAVGSDTYKLKTDSIGDGISGVAMSSASYQMSGGFVYSYPIPPEIKNLRFTSKTAITWDAEPLAKYYQIYTAELTTLPGGWGGCDQRVTSPPATLSGKDPDPGKGYFYLVTGANSIQEEGTKGYQSGNVQRTNTVPCSWPFP